jgi:hypothetical protein
MCFLSKIDGRVIVISSWRGFGFLIRDSTYSTSNDSPCSLQAVPDKKSSKAKKWCYKLIALEASMFPVLFPHGTGVYDSDRPDPLRFVESS